MVKTYVLILLNALNFLQLACVIILQRRLMRMQSVELDLDEVLDGASQYGLVLFLHSISLKDLLAPGEERRGKRGDKRSVSEHF